MTRLSRLRLAAVVVVAAVMPLAAGVLSAAPAAGVTAASPKCHTKATDDTDGDGRADPVIGVPGKTTGAGKEAGQVVAFHGTATGIKPVRSFRQGADGVPGIAGPDARFGYQIANGDITGNGCADVAILASGDVADNPQPPSSPLIEQGSITVLYGKPGVGMTTHGAQLLTANSLDLASYVGRPNHLDHFTHLLYPTFGDFNGDGYADLALLLLNQVDGESTYDLVIVPGSKHGLHPADRTVIREGSPTLPTQAGFDGLAAGDVNGDGSSDLAVGAFGDSDTPGADPKAEVIYGAKSGLGTGRHTQVWDRESPGIPGKDQPHEDGVATVAFGDFNGDGMADLVIGEPSVGKAIVIYGTKHGLTGTHSQILSPGSNLKGASGVDFGAVLATGDFNGDGADELVVGWADGYGKVSVIAGSHRHGLTTKGNLLWDPQTPGIPGNAPAPYKGSKFGQDLQIGFYGYGRGEDLLVSNPTGDHGAGTVTELFGSTTSTIGLTTKHAKQITESTRGVPGTAQPHDWFGGPPLLT
jgi:hypothetical protein